MIVSAPRLGGLVPSRSCSSSTWPRPCRAVVEGDLLLGGLHMVHERNAEVICGPIMPQGGLQAAEVMLYTLDQANLRVLGERGIRLGGVILDDCDRDTYGLQQATEFIKGRWNQLWWLPLSHLALNAWHPFTEGE